MKKIAILTFILTTCFATLHAQKQAPQYGITANAGLGKLRSPIRLENFDTEFSASFGLRGQWHLGEKSFLGAEFLWLQFAANSTYSADQVEFTTTTTENNITFFSVPFYYKYQVNQLGFKFGFQLAAFAFGKTKVSISRTSFGMTTNVTNERPLTEFNNPLNFGPKVGLDYKINDRLNIRADGFFDISDNVSNDEYVGVQQFTIGLDFNFKMNTTEAE